MEAGNRAATLENHSAISHQSKHATAIPTGNCTPGHLSRRSENLGSHKLLHMNVHTIIHNIQKLETTLNK